MNVVAIQDRDTVKWYILRDGKIVDLISICDIDLSKVSSMELSKKISLNLADKLPPQVSTLTVYNNANSPRVHHIIEEAILQHFECHIQIKGLHQSLSEAVCGQERGLIAMLSDTCSLWKFDGASVTHYWPSLGYIFGDRGSSAALGKEFVSSLLTGRLSSNVEQEFYTTFRLDAECLLDGVQNNALPKKFLTSLLPFISHHREEATIQALVSRSLYDYLSLEILPHYEEEQVYLIGEMTSFYGETLPLTCQQLGIRVGQILDSFCAPLLHLPTYSS